jgi:hypothetical protein
MPVSIWYHFTVLYICFSIFHICVILEFLVWKNHLTQLQEQGILHTIFPTMLPATNVKNWEAYIEHCKMISNWYRHYNNEQALYIVLFICKCIFLLHLLFLLLWCFYTYIRYFIIFSVQYMEKSFDPITRTGNFTYYFSHNASCSEVEIDCLTGEHQVNHSNINCKLFETGWLGGQDNVSELSCLPLNCFFYYSKTYFFRFCQFVFSKIRFLTSSVTLQLLFFILRFSLF